MSHDEAFLTELVRALASARLEAIVVGATAASLQGAPVLTVDVDLLIRDTRRNRQKLQVVCTHFGATAAPIEPGSRMLRISATPRPVDILFDEISGGLRFEALRSRALRISLGDCMATVASLDDIISSKVAADRPKDRAQLPILRDTLRVRNALARGPSPKRRKTRR